MHSFSRKLKTEGIEQPTNRKRNCIPQSVCLLRKMKGNTRNSLFPKDLRFVIIKHLVTLKPAISSHNSLASEPNKTVSPSFLKNKNKNPFS